MNILSSVPSWISLFLLFLLRSVHGAFTTTTCDPSRSICIQQSQGGSVCFYSSLTSPYSACNAPYSLPLRAHLNQNYAIGYYAASGQYLGRWNYPIQSGSVTVYVCMSARVSTTQYYTLCAQATADNRWQANGCAVGVAPPVVLDGCYASPPSPGTTGRTTTFTRLSTTTTTRVSTSYISPTNTTSTRVIGTSPVTFKDVSGTPTPVVVTTTQHGVTLVVTTTVGAPAAFVPQATSTSIKRDVLKDSAYSIIWAPITIALTIIGLIVHCCRSR